MANTKETPQDSNHHEAHIDHPPAKIQTTTDRNILQSSLLPEIEVETLEENLFCVGFKKSDLNLFAEGATREEALRNFWDYLYELFPLLEREEKNLGPLPQRQLKFLREIFECQVS